ncbi:MAG: CpaF family protein [Acidimicrobiales bacterium]
MSAPQLSADAAMEAEVHRRALELPVEELGAGSVERSVGEIVRGLCPLADQAGRAALVSRVVDRLRGLGPLEGLLQMQGVTEVMINGPGRIWLERNGRLAPTDIEVGASEIDHLIERMVAPLGRRLDRTSPVVDGRLPDGSRVHVAAPPVGVDGPYITIRRFEVTNVELEDITTPGVAQLLRWAVRSRCNILVSGGTSSGKTTVLNSLAREIPPGERLITVEDAAELRLPARHVVRLEARPPAMDGPPAITVRDLVRNALRMRPDRIIVGEVRGTEALDMLQAMNTGHEGSLSTVHANSAADALTRVETMVLMGSASLPQPVVREQLIRAVDLVVHLERDSSGNRGVVAVAEPEPGPSLDVRELANARTGLTRLPQRRMRRPGAAPKRGWIES